MDMSTSHSNLLSTKASATPPPGFSTHAPSAGGNRESLIQQGEALRGEGAMSAPPPIGLNSGAPGHEERIRLANHAIWGDARKSEESSSVFESADARKRTTSFSNLAAMLGNGLAESMDDATKSEAQSRLLTSEGTFDLSYARQSRHAASRILGSSGSGLSPTAGLLNLPLNMTLSSSLQQRLFAESSPLVRSGKSNKDEPPISIPAFTTSRETPEDPLSEFSAVVQHRQYPPTGFFSHSRPVEVGGTVIEPDYGRSSAPPQLARASPGTETPEMPRQGTPDTAEMQRGVQSLSSDGTRSVQSGSEVSIHSASEAEIEPFLWDVYYNEPSRALAILHVASMSTIDIRSCCEKFGALEVYRPDFSDRGIIFVGYYDIRSAQKAALDLRKNISLLTSSSTQVEIKYCVPLNSSSADDESVIILSDLPHYVDEREVLSILSSYGSVRSVNLLPGTHYGGRSYVIEFHNIQDAKLARLELETSQPWGPDTMIEVGVRRAVDRKRGRELLSIIGRWRQGSRQTGHQPPPSMTGTPHRSASASVSVRDDSTSSRSVNSSSALLESYHSHHYELHSSKTTTVPQQTTQLVLGPDGRYSYMVVSGNAFAPRAMPPLPQLNPHGGMEGFPVHLAQHQSMYHDPYGGGFVASVSPAQPHPSQIDWEQGTPVQQQHYQRPLVMSRPGTTNIPYASDGVVYLPHASAPSYFAQVVRTPADSTVSSGSNPRMHDATRRPQNDDKDHRHLLMDIAAVDAGKDTRTSLMVRNIPNKYTQQMLLSEFAESGHGPGTIDFFYLPIDFKNKCNRGYAFVNFVDYRDIVAFHRQYSGQHWRVFNSDKICEITYARIQGKAGMLKRFENSALMEKDEEYKPLVFVSQGPDKGKPLNFPTTIE